LPKERLITKTWLGPTSRSWFTLNSLPMPYNNREEQNVIKLGKRLIPSGLGICMIRWWKSLSKYFSWLLLVVELCWEREGGTCTCTHSDDQAYDQVNKHNRVSYLVLDIAYTTFLAGFI
jgi:hypothetical protein